MYELPPNFWRYGGWSGQIFAHVLLASGGRLHAVIPCQGYIETFDDQATRQEFQRLLSAADEVTVLPFSEPREEAFMAAGARSLTDASYSSPFGWVSSRPALEGPPTWWLMLQIVVGLWR